LTKKGKNPLQSFGFITTNSITQTFSRRVIEHYMAAKSPLSLIFAIPDHPWLKASDKAAVRIAMTVAARGEIAGKLAKTVSEAGLETDTPTVLLESRFGKVRADLTIGANLAVAKPLMSNGHLSSRGVMLFGSGFIVDATKAASLKAQSPSASNYILPYLNGKDVAARGNTSWVVDVYPLPATELQRKEPALYSHL